MDLPGLTYLRDRGFWWVRAHSRLWGPLDGWGVYCRDAKRFGLASVPGQRCTVLFWRWAVSVLEPGAKTGTTRGP